MIIDSFDAGVRQFPDRICLQSGELRLTYQEIENASHAVAHALLEQGLGSAHIGVLSPNHELALVAMLGIMRAGAVYVPLNARDTIDDIAWFMQFTDVSAMFCHETYLPQMEKIRSGAPALKTVIGLSQAAQPSGPTLSAWCEQFSGKRVETIDKNADDVAIIKSSGGTTGKPKAIMQTHRALETAYRISNQFTQPDKDPVHLFVAPFTHAAGATFMALARFGARNVLAPSTDPGELLALIECEKVTHIFLPPTLIYRLLAHPDVKTRDCSSLEYVIYGAAPMSVDKLREGLALWGQVFAQFYGQAEVPGVITCLSRKDHYVSDDSSQNRHLGSAGRPSGACEVALMDDNGNIVALGERGEIVAKGDLVSSGYYKNPEATAEVRAFGWHHTGDIGVFDESGYLYIVDRKKDMIISGGFNIYPSEIEQVIFSHPSVQDCAVVGTPDADWGERVTAIVELKRGTTITPEEVFALCKDRLASFKMPKHVEIWETLPRSPIGKVLKKDVRAKFLADALKQD
ncbi:AMP-binding protein [Paraburkholderia sp. BL10I2N1]|uniref:class I adenylate-forming enzyme family protein n=1 Tax=Paraburkholderia sp. BL10I2N1 TaxID=1938796 RepID=UPI00105F8E9E|nr:AMP-binding protein [Paraburkholderia sp. BL10I2N1]TDN58019.1 acyl-CoA synthetase (AMP-forming)/AMP-acid ligase II [Paraburkholderia sp. BL10I2N1]